MKITMKFQDPTVDELLEAWKAVLPSAYRDMKGKIRLIVPKAVRRDQNPDAESQNRNYQTSEVEF